MSDATPRLPARFERLQRSALLTGIVALGLSAVGGFAGPQDGTWLGELFNRAQFFRSYLVAFIFWVGVPLGSLAILMVHHLTGGNWGVVIRRILEASTRTLPLAALLFVPVALGVHDLYEWSHADVVANDPILRLKEPYLNEPFFLIRTGGYFVAWMILAWILNAWSARQDSSADADLTRRLRVASAIGLLVYGSTITFASIDWVMSLEPHWYSTIYGIIFAAGEVLAAFAFTIAVLVMLADTEPLASVLTRGHLRDLGSLLLAFVMFWAYVSFSQYLLIWSANLQEEVPWYIRRLEGGWEVVGIALVVLHFALPFVLLLSGDVKTNRRMLAGVALGILVMRFVDVYWSIAPVFTRGGITFHWMDAATTIGIGGLWLAFFLWQLGRRPLVPANASLSEEHGHA